MSAELSGQSSFRQAPPGPAGGYDTCVTAKNITSACCAGTYSPQFDSNATAISERAIIISTYALCGFANFSSIGIQIGGISAVAPKRKGDLARLGLKAMIGGALASWTTATIAGMLL